MTATNNVSTPSLHELKWQLLVSFKFGNGGSGSGERGQGRQLIRLSNETAHC